MTKNQIFRSLQCNLTIEQTQNLCFKSVRQVKSWDRGGAIPNECRRLMRLSNGLEISTSDEWKGFMMKHDRLELPTGQLVTSQQVLTGIALLQIQSDLEIRTSRQLLKLSRAIASIRLRS